MKPSEVSDGTGVAADLLPSENGYLLLLGGWMALEDKKVSDEICRSWYAKFIYPRSAGSPMS